jgi:hypothetical protein
MPDLPKSQTTRHEDLASLKSLLTSTPPPISTDNSPGKGRSTRSGRWVRLEAEIEENDLKRINELKVLIGVRSAVDVLRHCIKITFALLTQQSKGYEIHIVNPRDPSDKKHIVF